MTSPTVNLYTANHDYMHGIEDIVDIFSYAFRKRGIPLETSQTLKPGSINIIIDEFSSHKKIQGLLDFHKRYPETILLLVATEFCVKRLGVVSFNLFGSLMQCLKCLSYDTYLRKNSYFCGPSDRRHRIRGIGESAILAASSVAMPRKLWEHMQRRDAMGFMAWRIESHGIGYMHRRCLGLLAVLPCFTGYITMHPSISGTYKSSLNSLNLPPFLGNLVPEFNEDRVLHETRKGMRTGFEITGTLTKHRQNEVWKLNNELTKQAFQGTPTGLEHCIHRSWNEQESENMSALSFHPPQAASWRFGSPTRIYRAIQRGGNIPVITYRFNQCDTENLCLSYESTPSFFEKAFNAAASPQSRETYFRGKLSLYNSQAEKNNHELIDKALSFATSTPTHARACRI